MNTVKDGPYVCTAPGCTQHFQREDHLIIHRHKHEMTLKFSSIKCDNTLSDQTPTPTRFLRNCEEVGLFSDLELNQASDEEGEETRQSFSVQGSSRETQSEHHGSQQQQCVLAQFHTSHLPTHTSHSSSHCSMVRHTTHSSTNTHDLRSALLCLHNQQQHPVTCAMNAAPTMRMNTQLPMDSSMMDIPGPTHSSSCPTPQRSKVLSCQTHPMASNGNQNPMGHMMEMMSPQPVRMGLPLTHVPALPHQSYQQHGLSQSQQRHAHQHQSQEQSPHICAHHSPPVHLHPGPAPPAKHLTHQPISAQISPVPKNTMCAESPPQTSGGKRRRTADEDPDDRRRKFLERNRAAASRCRQKRKIWVMSLEKKAEELTHTNLQLQNEVTLLKSEVIQLKQLLLAHKDCPVTVRQRETQVGSPTGSSLQTQNIQHNSISSSSTTVAHTHLTTHSHSAS